MLKKFLLPFSLLAVSVNLLAVDGKIIPVTTDLPKSLTPKDQSESSEMRALDALIMVTEENLAAQKTLRTMLVDYEKMRIASMKDPKNRDQIDALVQKALEIQTLIQTNYLTHVFDSEFLSELNLFSQIASKPGLPSPVEK